MEWWRIMGIVICAVGLTVSFIAIVSITLTLRRMKRKDNHWDG